MCKRQKKTDFHFNYKEKSTHCYVKSRRINYAKKNYFNIFVCVNERKRKATFSCISKDKDNDVVRSTMSTEREREKKNYL